MEINNKNVNQFYGKTIADLENAELEQDNIKLNNALDNYARRMGALYAKKIDEDTGIFFVKPKWCSEKLYRFIGKHFIKIVFIRR